MQPWVNVNSRNFHGSVDDGSLPSGIFLPFSCELTPAVATILTEETVIKCMLRGRYTGLLHYCNVVELQLVSGGGISGKSICHSYRRADDC